MKPTINNHTSRDLATLTKTFSSFEEYARGKLGYNKSFTLNFISDEENSKNIFGKTAFYDPALMGITIYTDNRHDKDMLRSISHEMVHHAQNCRGEFDSISEMGEGYAQKDPHMRNMEGEAYLMGNGYLIRDYEDACKAGDTLVMEWRKTKKIKNLKRALLKESNGAVSPTQTPAPDPTTQQNQPQAETTDAPDVDKTGQEDYLEKLTSALQTIIKSMSVKAKSELGKIKKIENTLGKTPKAKLATYFLQLIGLDKKEFLSSASVIKGELGGAPAPGLRDSEESDETNTRLGNITGGLLMKIGQAQKETSKWRDAEKNLPKTSVVKTKGIIAFLKQLGIDYDDFFEQHQFLMEKDIWDSVDIDALTSTKVIDYSADSDFSKEADEIEELEPSLYGLHETVEDHFTDRHIRINEQLMKKFLRRQ